MPGGGGTIGKGGTGRLRSDGGDDKVHIRGHEDRDDGCGPGKGKVALTCGGHGLAFGRVET